jgi:predicted ATPase
MPPIIPKTFLQALRLERDSVASFEQYPFCIPAVGHLERLVFHPAVTFFIGENGAGESTLLEAIATKYGFNAEGGSKNFNFVTEKTHSDLHDFIRLERGARRPSDGFFLRAESFYNVATEIDKLGVERAYGGEIAARAVPW